MRIRPCTALSPIAAIAFAFCLQISGARAQSMEWTVIESTGSVLVVQPLVAARPVSLQDVMAPGSIVTTGGDGHAELRRGGQSIAIGPNSRIALPAAETGGMTKIIQDFGAALFKVDKQQNPHFEVDTPMIAAVVKGTTFTVSAGSADDSVHVVEGLVQVAPRSGGAPVPVPAGVTAVILHNNPGTIDLKQSNSGGAVAPMPAPAVAPIQEASNAIPQPIGAEPLDVKQLTNGLAVAGTAAASGAVAPAVQSVAAPTEVAVAPSVASENLVGASTAPIPAAAERTAAAANVAAIVQDNGGAHANANSGTGAGSNGLAAANTSAENTSVVAPGNAGSNATTDATLGNANSGDANAVVGKKDERAKPVNANAIVNASGNAPGNAVAEDTKKGPAEKDKDTGNENANANGNAPGNAVAEDTKKGPAEKDKDKGNENANANANAPGKAIAEDTKKGPAEKDNDKGNENANANGNANDNVLADDSKKGPPAPPAPDKGKANENPNGNGPVIAVDTGGPGPGTSENANGNGNTGPIAIASGNSGKGKAEDAGKSEKGKAAPRGLIRP